MAYNGTGTPPSVVVAPKLQSLVNVTGTQWKPVTNVSYKDVEFQAAAYTCVLRTNHAHTHARARTHAPARTHTLIHTCRSNQYPTLTNESLTVNGDAMKLRVGDNKHNMNNNNNINNNNNNNNNHEKRQVHEPAWRAKRG